MLIVGEPGIGKSRLVEEFRARLGETRHSWIEWSSSQLLPAGFPVNSKACAESAGPECQILSTLRSRAMRAGPSVWPAAGSVDGRLS